MEGGDLLRDLALTRRLGRVGQGVTVGGWLLEPYCGACKSNETPATAGLGARYASTLGEERLAYHALGSNRLPG